MHAPMQYVLNALAYLATAVSYKCKKVFKTVTCSQFHKHLTLVTNGPSKISSTVHCMYAPMLCFQNALAYFDMAVSYMSKKFVKYPLC
jgi:hypothetical protein